MNQFNLLHVSLLPRTVENASEFLHLVIKGLQLRVRHPTLVHAHSSRSHLVVTLTITTVVSGDGFGKEDVTKTLCETVLFEKQPVDFGIFIVVFLPFSSA